MARDFAKHNEQVKQIWDTFKIGNPKRVPVVFGITENYYILNPNLNTKGYTYEQYCENPDIMMEIQLALQKWIRFNIFQDAEMGLPSSDWNEIHVDFQNTAEAAWLGCPVIYGSGGSVPDTKPILDKKEKLDDMEIPDPIHGNIMGRAYEFTEYFSEKLKNYEYEGKPVKGVIPVAHMTDGPFTLASKLRGATQLCIDVYEDPDFVHKLMKFVTKAIIARGRAWWPFMGVELPMDSWMQGFADDCAEFLSVEMYKEFVQPYHCQLVQTFSKGGPVHIHMCGRAQHLFKTMQKELNMQDFYVGYFTDVGKMREELGDDVSIMAECIHPTVLQQGNAEEIKIDIKKRMTSKALKSRKLVVSATVGPDTSPKAINIAYEAAKEYGQYSVA